MLLDDVIDAHGGVAAWERAQRVRVHARSGGVLVRTRLPGNHFREGRLVAEIGAPVSSAGPFPRAGMRGAFDHGAVRIETDDGEVVESRERPRELFFGTSGLRRNLRWDALDATYFAGYAWWNYLNAPYLLARDDIHVAEIEPWDQRGETWRRLEAHFPDDLDTHSARQVFYFDSELRLRRHDYVAEIIGKWAHAAHMCDAHVESGGLVFPTRRRVYPIGPRNRPLPGPVLVALDLLEIDVESAV